MWVHLKWQHKGNLQDLIVAHLTDSRWWLHWKGDIGYVSWQGNNIFLTPAHNWMHDCILYWTRKWDPSLMTSTVWPNLRQGIMAMLGDGTVGRLLKPGQGKGRKWKLQLAHKGAVSVRFVIWPSYGFWRSDHHLSEGPQNKRYAWAQPSYRLFQRPRGHLSNRC